MDDDCPPPPPVQHTSADEDEADLDDSRRLTAVADVSSSSHCGLNLDLEVPVSDPEQAMSPVPAGLVSFVVPDDSSTSALQDDPGASSAPDMTTSSLDASLSLVQQTFDGDSSLNAFEDAPEVSTSLESSSSAFQRSQLLQSESANGDGGALIVPESGYDNNSTTLLNQALDTVEPEGPVQKNTATSLTNDFTETVDSAKVSDEDAKETNDNDDEFGDFEEFGDFAAVQLGSATVTPDSQETNDGAGWAAFGSAPVTSANEGWAADFSSVGDWPPARSDTPPPPTSAAAAEELQIDSTTTSVSVLAEKPRLPSLSSLIEDANLWDVGGDGIPESGSEETTTINDLLRSFDCDKSVGTSDDALKRAFDVWLALRIIEETMALKCQWTGSTTNTCFLKALNMDANLAKLRNTGLPVFAQQLGGSLLTPMAPGQQPLSDVMSPTSSNGKVTLSASSSIPVDSLSVPPAQFDWRNSGLTNPLTAASVNASSTILDLDFLTANESGGKGGNIAAALQKDLDALGLNSPTHSAKNTDSAVKQPSLLDQLMSQSANKTTKIIPVTELSVEAKALHDALPNLDYMHSSVLMFPIRRQDGGSK